MLSLLSVSSSLVVPVLSDLAQYFFFTYIILSNVVIRICVGKLVLIGAENLSHVGKELIDRC